MASDIIKLGETYDLSITAKDSAGDAITMDANWSAACRITKDKIGGTTILEPTLTIAAGVATGSVDTNDGNFAAGVYYYDIRLTDGNDDDFWSEPIKLTIQPRNTPPS